MGHSIISQSLGEIIISESFGLDKALFKILKLGPICKRLQRSGPYYSFIKFWGQNEISGKCHCSKTVAGTVAIRLTGYEIRKTGYGAASLHCESGLPDSKNGKPDMPRM